MRVILISANTEQINTPVLPLGMAKVAAATVQAGHDVQVINPMRPEQVKELLTETVLDFAPEIIGVSVRNIDDQDMNQPRFLLPAAREVIKECRRISEAPVVLGGPGYSIFPGPALEYLGADYGIVGEGERAFPVLLDRLARRRPLPDIPGLVKPPGEIVRPPELILRLDEYPLAGPDILLKGLKKEGLKELWIPFQTRRGCPMDCSYCSTPAIEGRTPRKLSIEKVIDSLRAFTSSGCRRFFFVDNTFNLPSKYVESLCDAIIEAGLNIEWHAIVYPMLINAKVAKKMAGAGCVGVSLGFESGSPKILSALNKRFSPDDVRRVSEVLRNFGISRMGFLLLGGPGETRGTVAESVSFAESLKLESVKLTAGIRIYPNSALAKEAVRRGLLPPDSNLLYPTFFLEPELNGWLQEEVVRLAKENDAWVA